MAQRDDTANGGGFAPPNHTQTPNEFFDEVLPQIDTMSEMKVTLVIIRKTFGWHKDEDQISLKQLEEFTGMNRQQVVAGCKSAIRRGYVWCEKRGGRNYFGLHVGGIKIIPPSSMPIIPTKERVKERDTSSSEDVDGEPSPGTFVAYLREELDGSDVPLLRNREERYAGEFNRVIKKGMTADVLYKAADRIVERWKGDEHRKLTVEQALEDVVNGKPPKHAQDNGGESRKASGTPPEAIEYVFANAVGECFRNNEARIRRAMEQHNFTGYEYPSYPVQKMLGGTDQEIWQAMDGLESLLGRWKREEQRS